MRQSNYQGCTTLFFGVLTALVLLFLCQSCRRNPVSDLEVYTRVGQNTLSYQTYIDFFSRNGTWIVIGESYDATYGSPDTCACWEVYPSDTLHHGYNHNHTTFQWKEVYRESQCSTSINKFYNTGHF